MDMGGEGIIGRGEEGREGVTMDSTKFERTTTIAIRVSAQRISLLCQS